MSTKLEEINRLLDIRDSYQAPAKIMEVLLEWERQKRYQLYLDFIELHRYKLDFDWFHEYFQDEHADRKNDKQDFTPRSLSKLMAALSPSTGIIYEPAAGTGGLLIQVWHQERLKHEPWDFDPLSQFFIAEEKSDKTVPFLLFNLAIRGMHANVIHGDAITRQAWAAYHVENEKNDAMSFSEVFELPKTKPVEKMLNIIFEEAQP